MSSEPIATPDFSKYLIFGLGDQTYAVSADQIKEIVSDLPCFAVPFTPEWVRGVLNRQGVPFTILDLQALLGGPPLETRFHALLGKKGDHIALAISEVKEILRIPSSSLRRLSSREGIQVYFEGALVLEQGDVFVFQIEEILRKLANDVQTS